MVVLGTVPGIAASRNAELSRLFPELLSPELAEFVHFSTGNV
jgi:hypothetical protein